MAPMTTSTTLQRAPTRTFLGGPDVPRVGIGLAALGRPGYINLGHNADLPSKTVEQMRLQAWEVLDEAHRLGIRYYDAARSYGRAEEFLSGWLQARGHVAGPGSSGQGNKALVVGSKWGYAYTANWQTQVEGGGPHEVKDHSAAHLAKQQEETSALLGPYLNLYQIHSATLESGVLKAPDVLLGLERLKKDKGWRIGLSLSGVAQAETLRLALQTRMSCGTQMLFDSVQATWNLMEQSAGAALLEAHQAGLDVIIKEAVANGRLTPRNLSHPTQGPQMQLLQRRAQEMGCGMDALALAAVLAQPFEPVVLSGATTLEQLRSNVQALEVLGQLEPGSLSELQDAFRQPADQYWGERSKMAWN